MPEVQYRLKVCGFNFLNKYCKCFVFANKKKGANTYVIIVKKKKNKNPLNL